MDHQHGGPLPGLGAIMHPKTLERGLALAVGDGVLHQGGAERRGEDEKERQDASGEIHAAREAGNRPGTIPDVDEVSGCCSPGTPALEARTLR